MRRAVSIVAAAILLAVLPLTLSGCWITCGCARPADPNWTPLPVSAADAAIYAAKVAGVPAMEVTRTAGPNGRQVYIATAAETVALVDAVSGFVVEVVLEDRMPDGPAESATTADAQTAAEAFMQKTGQSTDGFTESVSTIRIAGVAAYEVVWTDPSGVPSAKYAVSVNAATGSVFAFLDERMQLNLTAPIIGSARASELAIAALGIPSQTLASPELSIDFSSGSQASAWQIGLGVPSATGSNAFEHGGLVRVDAVTGVATIVQS
jgi:hypothetical protein